MQSDMLWGFFCGYDRIKDMICNSSPLTFLKLLDVCYIYFLSCDFVPNVCNVQTQIHFIQGCVSFGQLSMTPYVFYTADDTTKGEGGKLIY